MVLQKQQAADLVVWLWEIDKQGGRFASWHPRITGKLTVWQRNQKMSPGNVGFFESRARALSPVEQVSSVQPKFQSFIHSVDLWHKYLLKFEI